MGWRDMKFSEILDALARHFNDIIGSVIPGAVLLFGLGHLGVLEKLKLPELSEPTIYQLIVWIFAAFLTGHFLSEVNKSVLSRWLGKGKPSDLEKRASFVAFRSWVQNKSGAHSLSLETAPSGGGRVLQFGEHELRSMAMTLSDEAKFLSRRFKFIELLCGGTSTALILIATLTLTIELYQLICGLWVEPMKVALVIIEVCVALPLYKRASHFRGISGRVCFDCVMAEILNDQK